MTLHCSEEAIEPQDHIRRVASRAIFAESRVKKDGYARATCMRAIIHTRPSRGVYCALSSVPRHSTRGCWRRNTGLSGSCPDCAAFARDFRVDRSSRIAVSIVAANARATSSRGRRVVDHRYGQREERRKWPTDGLTVLLAGKRI